MWCSYWFNSVFWIHKKLYVSNKYLPLDTASFFAPLDFFISTVVHGKPQTWNGWTSHSGTFPSPFHNSQSSCENFEDGQSFFPNWAITEACTCTSLSRPWGKNECLTWVGFFRILLGWQMIRYVDRLKKFRCLKSQFYEVSLTRKLYFPELWSQVGMLTWQIDGRPEWAKDSPAACVMHVMLSAVAVNPTSAAISSLLLKKQRPKLFAVID